MEPWKWCSKTWSPRHFFSSPFSEGATGDCVEDIPRYRRWWFQKMKKYLSNCTPLPEKGWICFFPGHPTAYLANKKPPPPSGNYINVDCLCLAIPGQNKMKLKTGRIQLQPEVPYYKKLYVQISCAPPKTDMKIEKQPFEDLSPSNNGDFMWFSIVMLVFRGV